MTEIRRCRSTNGDEQMRLIDADALYKRTAEWEAQAQMQLEPLTKMRLQDMNRTQRDEFIKWSAVLAERSAFKFDIADAPTISTERRGHWIMHEDRACWYCSECATDDYYAYIHNSDTGVYELQDKFCPNCGAKMEEEES